MSEKPSIQIPYNHDLKPLEELLARVKRPGDFFVSGAREMPMPKVEVAGAGVLSFPVPQEQVTKLIDNAVRAPYGRGEATILDTSVRKVWQVSPEKVSISGKSWQENFDRILGRVTEGLGCGKADVRAELYKLLVYDEGGFFVAHRDTEKAPGMFGTLVIVLPSPHCGGDLVVRHAGREVKLDLSNTEVSELSFAAFYADCEHEVRPITSGNRVCLVYNLVQQPHAKGGRTRQETLTAPLYHKELAEAAAMLEKALTDEQAPAKIAWLFEHQYTPAELSSATLKNADAARGKLLAEAAKIAGCTVHLGIVHIGDSGAAEPAYSDYHHYRGRSRWHGYDDDEEEADDSSSDDFEVVDVCDSWQHVDDWVNLEGGKVEFGKIPLADGELLPAGALDGEKPDEQSCTEATGNEGASYERSYHRAAMVIWRHDRYAEVLLQAGVQAVLPYLKERVREASAASAPGNARRQALALAKRVVEAWEPSPAYRSFGQEEAMTGRPEMLQMLCELGEGPLVEQFIAKVVIPAYDGSENTALAKAARLMEPSRAGDLFARLMAANMRWTYRPCVNLLSRLAKAKASQSGRWDDALFKTASGIVEKLAAIGTSSSLSSNEEWWRKQQAKPLDSSLVVELFEALGKPGTGDLRETAAAQIASCPAAFDPVKVVVPALVEWRQRLGAAVAAEPSFVRLWHHAAEFLLTRSERRPEPPRDWRQKVKIECGCDDCRQLEAFALDAVSQVYRFRVRKDRRQHLHMAIERHELDMTHVTDRDGSPQTLVCTKTRLSYERRGEQYRQDIAAMSALLPLLDKQAGEAVLAKRLAGAIGRH